jgi:hypothetical protein
MFGKTWGLRLHVVYWIYTAVIRPIITYSITVWWPQVKQARQNLANCKGWLA